MRYQRWGSVMVTILLTVMFGFGGDNARDAELVKAAQARLSSANLGSDVRVSVANAIVRLDGTVDSIAKIERAGKAISKIEGVASVSNNLQVPAGEDGKVAAEAARQVRMYPYFTIFDNVEVEARDGVVVLTGEVTKPTRKTEIGLLMKNVPGVKEVENNLEVLPISPFDDEIRLRVARAIYGDGALYRYGLGANPPIHIVVKNGNVRLTGVVNSRLEKMLAERNARFAANYFGLVNDLRVEQQAAKVN
jgi:hyperosmotically inducible periplasmic protein